MIKAILFDCFGVVVGKGIWNIFELAGGDLTKDAEYVEDLVDKEALNQLHSGEFNQKLAERVGMTLDQWNEFSYQHDQANVEVLEYIQTIKKSGIKVALLSNASSGVIEKRLSKEQLGIFDAVVISGDVGFAKPDSRIFDHALRTLGVNADECLFTDDHEEYLVGAQKLGMKTIHYRNFEQFKNEIEQLLNY